MKSGPSLARMMLLAVLISSVAAPARAQNEPPPDLNMLLNLDLFKPNPNAAAQNGGDGSMLEQIQTLSTLGYFGPNRSAPDSYAPPPPPQNIEPSPPSGESEIE